MEPPLTVALIPSGTVFQLSKTQSGITEKVLHNFGASGDGAFPYDPVVADPAGNLYGATSIGGVSGSGCVYRLSLQNGSWTESVLHSFTGHKWRRQRHVLCRADRRQVRRHLRRHRLWRHQRYGNGVGAGVFQVLEL